MRESFQELVVGESVVVGDRLLTVVDMTDEEVTFRIEQIPPGSHFCGSGNTHSESEHSWNGVEGVSSDSDEIDSDWERTRSRPR